MRRFLSSSKLCMTSSPAVWPHRVVRWQHLTATCVDTCVCFLQLLTDTHVAGRQNNFFFCPASMYFSLWLAFINKSHDFLAQRQMNSSEAYCSHCKNQYGRAFKKLSKCCQRFAFKYFPAICFQKGFKHFPAICFQFSSDLLSKSFQLFSFQKAFKNFPAISFQKFSSDLLSKSFQNFSSD